jgi:hypothetical protein
MSPQIPVEDPSDRGSLVDRTVEYVRGNAVLRVLLIATVVDHVVTIVLVLVNRINGELAGLLALLSLLAWFFAVCMPVMNRALRERLGGAEVGYWSEVAEMFATVALCAVAVLYTATLIGAVALD